ncbi:MAG TPA: STN and carboxypeptidase regulatory-like domain-containing protein [Phnomibacter sp.]|nr:STN and carboxypeptidase regulatory-like domain-containing protein [Phnomibacter sp.]
MRKLGLVLAILLALQGVGRAQSNLSKTVSINMNRQPLADVLEIISNQGNFYFSYNSAFVRRDSLVSISASGKTVQQVLLQLFNSQYEFKESGNYVIIKRKPLQLTIVTKPVTVADKYYAVNGYILDADNGVKLSDASVYEKDQLVSTLSNSSGYFNLRLKAKYPQAALTVSKELYEDTTVLVNAAQKAELNISIVPLNFYDVVISPEDYFLPDSTVAQKQLDTSAIRAYRIDTAEVDKRWFTRFFVSNKTQKQSGNIGNWFAQKPFQVSIIPGLSTQGKMSGQVVNNFSLNVFGGYTGGVKGFEIAGFFNINKKDVKYFQASGMFNLTGGNQEGFQAAGIANTVLGYTKGFQVAGVSNYNRLNMHGFQAGGVFNYNQAGIKGFQAAGVYNHSGGYTAGMQVSGVFNFARQKLQGVQVAGVANYCYHNKGLQISVINIADTSDGYSIGLINFVRRGYHKLYLGTDETLQGTFSIKSGNRKLYSMLIGGMNWEPDNRMYSFGYGIGREWVSTRHFALSTDATSQYLYLGSMDYLNLLNRFNVNLHLRISKGFAIYGGPSINFYYSDQTAKVGEYAIDVPRNGYGKFTMDGNWRGWGGWHAGIALF